MYSMFCGNLPVSEGHHIRFFNRRRMEQTLIFNGFDQVQYHGFGRGDFYLDRAIGERTRSLRGIALRLVFKLWGALSWKSLPSYYSGLMFLAVKSEREPIGLDPTVRDYLYPRLSREGKSVVLEKLLPLRKFGFFDEHPGFREFIDQEAEVAGPLPQRWASIDDFGYEYCWQMAATSAELSFLITRRYMGMGNLEAGLEYVRKFNNKCGCWSGSGTF